MRVSGVTVVWSRSSRAALARTVLAPVALVALVVLVALPVIARPAAAQFTPHGGNDQNILEGHWSSCQDPPGGPYAERVYDHVVNGVGQFEVHLGPRREFAIFKGVEDAHRDHAAPDNLLKPFRVIMHNGRARQRWELPSLNLVFTVTMGGGSRTDCESWYIVLEPLKKSSQ
jgi:hypothetical protein